MGRTRRYLLTIFVSNYLLIFLPFFVIVSLVFFVRISVLSSKVNLDTFELLQLFGYFLPEIIFFTIPLSFMAALANTFSRLSEGNELVALFALGYKPMRLIRIMFPMTLLFSILLVVVSLMVYPQMKQKLSQFKAQKVAEATLNIEPRKLSQSFGDFHIYAESKEGNRYYNLVLFDNQDAQNYRLFVAKEGQIDNNNSIFTLSLYNGTGESSTPQKIQTLRYGRLTLYRYSSAKLKPVVTLKEYWQKAKTDKRRRANLLYLLFVSLSPLLTFAPIVALSIYNPRYQKSATFTAIFVIGMALYIPAAILKKSGSIELFGVFTLLFLAVGWWILAKRVLKRY